MNTGFRAAMYMVRKEGQVFGPFTSDEVKEMVKTACLTEEDEISHQDIVNWQKLKHSNLWYQMKN